MNGTSQRMLSATVVSLALMAPLAGCTARPAPRPAPTSQPAGSIDPALSAAVANTASLVQGAGSADAIVSGNMALIALQTNLPLSGGTQGSSLLGNTTAPSAGGSTPGGGPDYAHGAGMDRGISPARPGGGVAPGGIPSPGTTPPTTQAVPNASGDPAPSGTSSMSGSPGTLGSAPMDVMTRVANRVMAAHPQITEVRFATDPNDAARVTALAQAIRSGQGADGATAEASMLSARAIPAGLTPLSQPPERPGAPQ